MIRHILMLVLPALLLGSGIHARELTIIAEELPPYQFLDNGTLTGSTVAVVDEIQRRLGTDEPIQVMPWARAYHMGLTEPDVLLLSTVRTPEREGLFHWVGPLSITRMAFYARSDADMTINSLEDAKSVGAIGTYRRDVKEQLLQKHGFTNLDSASDPSTNLRKLLTGRIDLWTSFDLSVQEQAREANIDPGLLKQVFVLDTAEVYLAFSKETPQDMVDAWSRTLEHMKMDGTFYALSSPWLPDANLPEDGHMSGSDMCPSPLKLYTENAPPSSFLENGRLKGIAVEIVEKIKTRTGTSCPIHLVPWARGYELARSRELVGLFAATRIPQREDLFKWVGPLYSQTWGFYAHKDSEITLSSLEDAKKVRRIGTYRKDAKEQYLLDKGFTNLISANNNEVNPRHLVSGLIDLWVSSDLKMPYFARQAGINPLDVKLVLPFHSVDNYIIFSRGTPQMVVDQWQQALDTMKEDGTYARIFENWTDVEWARKD